MSTERPVIVTTEHRGVFFGYATDTSGDAIYLKRARMAGSDFARHDNALWVTVEKYLQGQVTDLGGKTPNLHLLLADGSSVKVATSQEQVLGEEQNLVYRSALLRVRAEQDIASRRLRNVRLIEFVHPQSHFDANAFNAMVEKGRKAWADVPNASAWVEEQRGAA